MRSRSTDSRNSCSVDLRAVMSTNVSTTPSIRLSEVRYGVRRIAYQRPSRVTTSRSTGLKSLSTAAMSLLRSEPSRLLETSESGRPRSEGIRLNRFRIVGVNSLIRVSAIQEERADFSGIHQIEDVVGHLRLFLNLDLQLLVHRRELFVDRLELLLAGFEFFR